MYIGQFPQEIYDLIIDESSDSQLTLKTLCLVCKSWLSRTRTHLFRRLCIAKLSLDDRPVTRLRILEKSYAHLMGNQDITKCIQGYAITPEALNAGDRFGRPPFAGAYIFSSFPPPLPTGPRPATTNPFYNPCELPEETPGGEFLLFQPLIYKHSISEIITFFHEACSDGSLTGIKKLAIPDALFYADSIISNRPYFHIFKCLAEYTPALHTLCMPNLTLSDGFLARLSASVIERAARTAIGSLGDARENVAESRAIALQRFFFTNLERGFRSNVHNTVIKVLFFESRFVTFVNLVYLGIFTTSLPLFALYSAHFGSVKHLTIIDRPLSGHDRSTESWAYDRARFELPALSTLHLVLFRYEGILTLCRLLLGPSATELTADPETSPRIEYPGPEYFSGLEDRTFVAEKSRPYPHLEHLHLEFDFSQTTFSSTFRPKPERVLEPVLDKSLAERIDAALFSYLDAGADDDYSSHSHLQYISVNQPDSELDSYWPRSRSTRRVYQGSINAWWDSDRW